MIGLVSIQSCKSQTLVYFSKDSRVSLVLLGKSWSQTQVQFSNYEIISQVPLQKCQSKNVVYSSQDNIVSLVTAGQFQPQTQYSSIQTIDYSSKDKIASLYHQNNSSRRQQFILVTIRQQIQYQYNNASHRLQDIVVKVRQ